MPLATVAAPACAGARVRGCSRGTRLVAHSAVRTTTEAKPEVKPVEVKVREGHEKDGLTPEQVVTLIDLICDQTQFAQVELEIGAFQMRVVRRTEAAAPVAVAAPAPVVTQSPEPRPAPAASSVEEYAEEEDDGTVMPVTAPTVGIMRRGKYVKGKRVGKGNSAEEGDTVKKGQVLAYVEKLGIFEPVLAPQAGEVGAFVVEDGEPVSYGDVILEMSPFFGGHIIGDSKHA